VDTHDVETTAEAVRLASAAGTPVRSAGKKQARYRLVERAVELDLSIVGIVMRGAHLRHEMKD